eukprot:gnl/Hemi2/25755_TR8659_c0_g1_i1.p1 gnl/Hemi2/25755_TR8659_c0_g1~~gnl/Hemi2/25755_TR8659_c0_g1_i1.p1  ORF type:complete len:176 (+),score=2.06 gnl/Hemi2/25755_TR8659_c0_g1_i1:78-605(+)
MGAYTSKAQASTTPMSAGPPTTTPILTGTPTTPPTSTGAPQITPTSSPSSPTLDDRVKSLETRFGQGDHQKVPNNWMMNSLFSAAAGGCLWGITTPFRAGVYSWLAIKHSDKRVRESFHSRVKALRLDPSVVLSRETFLTCGPTMFASSAAAGARAAGWVFAVSLFRQLYHELTK